MILHIWNDNISDFTARYATYKERHSLHDMPKIA